MDKDKIINEIIEIRKDLYKIYDERKELNEAIKKKKELLDKLFSILEDGNKEVKD